MLSKYVAACLIFLLLNMSLSFAVFAGVDSDKEAKHTAKIKKGIKKLGTGADARIKIKLYKDKKKIRGYVKEARDQDFTIVDKKTGAERTFEYSEIRHVSGKNMALGVKIAIGTGIVIAAIFIIIEVLFGTGAIES